MENNDNRQVLIEASYRFAIRREAAELDTGVDEASVIKNEMASQLRAYLSSLEDEHSPSVSSALYSMLSETMKVGVLSSDSAAVEADGILPSSDFGVVYVKGERQQISPRMYMSLGMISLMQKQFHPFLGDDPEIINPAQRLASSVVAGSWFTLGKWTIDTIDPRYVKNLESNKDAISAILQLTDIDLGSIDIDRQNEEIGNSLLVLSYRMAGAMAYKGLSRYLKREELPYDPSTLSIFQQMQSAYYDRQIEEDISYITPINFALAKPLLAREVKLVFNHLEPVAKDLQQQNRLTSLNY